MGPLAAIGAVIGAVAATVLSPLAAAGQPAAAATPAPQVLSVGAPAGLKPVHPSAGPDTVNEVTLHSSAPTGVVAPAPRVYLVFWGSQWSTDPAGAEPALQAFFRGLYGSDDRWGTILDQYCEGLAVHTVNCGSAGTHITHPSASVLAGVWSDTTVATPAQATGAQIAAEAAAAAAHFGNTTQARNLDAQYVIASPHGARPVGFLTQYCGWHSSARTTDGVISYTNLPYVPDAGAGGCTTLSAPTALDGYFSTETHEYAETVTDMRPNEGWLALHGNEIGDKCENLDARESLTTGVFDVQGIWSNTNRKCLTAPVP